MEFVMGGTAACGAALVTNPLEVAKTRIQLQGELQARGKYTVHYRNVFHALFTIASHDGLRAIQSGLSPALCYQFFMNGTRLGAFHIMEDLRMTKKEDGKVSMPKSILAGAAAGSVGAFVASPLYMVKIQLQSKSLAPIAVGYQHRTSSLSEALFSHFENGGIRGLWRGAGAAMVRVSVGSSVQLSTFSKIRSVVAEIPGVRDHMVWATLFSSIISGSFLCLIMTPLDVVCTRLYNQGVDPVTRKGLTYSGFGDCLNKIFKTEGVRGFYKGVSAAFIRIGPHTVLTLMMWSTLRERYQLLGVPQHHTA